MLPRTAKSQGICVVVGFIVLVVLLGGLYAYGTPTPWFDEEAPSHAYLDALAYLFPCLAGVCAGAGLFVRLPGRVTENPTADAKDTDKDDSLTERIFYICSVVFLVGGLASYALCHPCKMPALVIIISVSLMTMAMVLLGRVFAESSKGRGATAAKWIGGVMVAVATAAVFYGVVNFDSFFMCGVCAS